MRALILVIACAGCFPRFDLDQPIALVPGASLDERQVEIVAAAARCWELGFGVPFIVDPRSTEPQQIAIDFNEFACDTRLGQYMPGVPAAIDLCPHAYSYVAGPVDDDRLFQIILHELGHASGIEHHATSRAAVLGEALGARLGSRLPVFDPEDEALFQSENDRDNPVSCDVRMFATDSSSVPQCGCAPPCEPDVLEPSELDAPAPLVADADLSLCIDDRDAYEVIDGGRLRIESDDPELTVITYGGGAGSVGQRPTTPGVFTIDAAAGTFVSVQNGSTSRDTVTRYRITFLAPDR